MIRIKKKTKLSSGIKLAHNEKEKIYLPKFNNSIFVKSNSKNTDNLIIQNLLAQMIIYNKDSISLIFNPYNNKNIVKTSEFKFLNNIFTLVDEDCFSSYINKIEEFLSVNHSFIVNIVIEECHSYNQNTLYQFIDVLKKYRNINLILSGNYCNEDKIDLIIEESDEDLGEITYINYDNKIYKSNFYSSSTLRGLLDKNLGSQTNCLRDYNLFKISEKQNLTFNFILSHFLRKINKANFIYSLNH